MEIHPIPMKIWFSKLQRSPSWWQQSECQRVKQTLDYIFSWNSNKDNLVELLIHQTNQLYYFPSAEWESVWSVPHLNRKDRCPWVPLTLMWGQPRSSNSSLSACGNQISFTPWCSEIPDWDCSSPAIKYDPLNLFAPEMDFPLLSHSTLQVKMGTHFSFHYRNNRSPE